MTKRWMLAGFAGLVLALVPWSSASAGGWAVTSLDPVPSLGAGTPVTVTFTVRQHGVTPVWPDGGGVALVVAMPDGREVTFPATQGEAPGRYSAVVELPEAGSYRWQVRQGWFAPQDLGTLEVGTAAASTGAGGPRGSAGVRALLPAAAAALGGLALIDAWRRRRPAPAVVA